MRKPDVYEEEYARAVEIVQIAVPVLCEAIAVIFAVGVACMWVIIYATRVPVPA
jgi:hypothetical protein